MSAGRMKQILLITDGCSNEGSDPVAIASMAPEMGITINVIGILNDRGLGEKGIEEVKAIAGAGGGVHEVVYTQTLAKTVQMVTRKAMTQTIHQVVNQELTHILGEEQDVSQLSPAKRGKVVDVVEHLGETMELDIIILVDTSASMKTKLPSVRQALVDLCISLQSRMGKNRFSLWTYPGVHGSSDKVMDWSEEFSSLENRLTALNPGGTTPTGPALEDTLRFFSQHMPVESRRIAGEEEGMIGEHQV